MRADLCNESVKPRVIMENAELFIDLGATGGIQLLMLPEDAARLSLEPDDRQNQYFVEQFNNERITMVPYRPALFVRVPLFLLDDTTTHSFKSTYLTVACPKATPSVWPPLFPPSVVNTAYQLLNGAGDPNPATTLSALAHTTSPMSTDQHSHELASVSTPTHQSIRLHGQVTPPQREKKNRSTILIGLAGMANLRLILDPNLAQLTVLEVVGKI